MQIEQQINGFPRILLFQTTIYYNNKIKAKRGWIVGAQEPKNFQKGIFLFCVQSYQVGSQLCLLSYWWRILHANYQVIHNWCVKEAFTFGSINFTESIKFLVLPRDSLNSFFCNRTSLSLLNGGREIIQTFDSYIDLYIFSNWCCNIYIWVNSWR